MSQLAAVNFVNTRSSDAVERALRDGGFHVFAMDGLKVVDAPSFFAEATKRLPLDPPLSGNVNWDALSDSLFEGLSNQPSRKVAIELKGADGILAHDCGAFFCAVNTLYQVVLDLNDPRNGLEKPVELVVVVLGAGSNFRDNFL